jgi:hypothetical protein
MRNAAQYWYWSVRSGTSRMLKSLHNLVTPCDVMWYDVMWCDVMVMMWNLCETARWAM